MTPDDADPPPEDSSDVASGAQERRGGGDRRRGVDRRQRQVPVAHERRSGVDRRVTPDRRAGRRAGGYDLDEDTLELIAAVGKYRERTGKTFPTWSDLLDILRSLGWEKRS
jgi:hypothetical protein